MRTFTVSRALEKRRLCTLVIMTLVIMIGDFFKKPFLKTLFQVLSYSTDSMIKSKELPEHKLLFR